VTGSDRDGAWNHHPDGGTDEGPRAVGHDAPTDDEEPDGDRPGGGGRHAAAPNRAAEDGDDREWNDPPGVEDETGENVFGSGDARRPVEAGTVVAEHAAFVVVGVLVALGAVFRLVGVF